METRLHYPPDYSMILPEDSINAFSPLPTPRSDYGVHVYTPNGREMVTGYQARNIVQVVQCNAQVNPSGRVYPTGEYQGRFSWLVQRWNRLATSGTGSVIFIMHGDGSVEWTTTTSPALPAGWQAMGLAGNILGIVER